MNTQAAKADSPYASIRDACRRVESVPTDESFDAMFEAEEERCRKRVEKAVKAWAKRMGWGPVRNQG
jgi:hypothetical protein